MDTKILDLTRADPRYPYEAYEFVCAAVPFTQESLGRAPGEEDDPDTDYNVTAEELARGCCELALLEFGMMARVVFQQWNLRSGDDLGNVVFNLVQGGSIAPSEHDDPEDFRHLFDLDQALQEGFAAIMADPHQEPR